MTAPPERSLEARWDEEGRRLGATLDGCSSAVIVGDDPLAAAHVALGIGRVQARRRRVAIGDLVGDVPPLRPAAAAEELHGLSDCFLYGVSMNRVAHPVDGLGNLFLLPSGTEPPAQEEILANPRWSRLVAGFREVGALLLLVVRTDAPGLEKLAAAVDGAVLVGSTTPPQGIRVIAQVERPRGRGSAGAALVSVPPGRVPEPPGGERRAAASGARGTSWAPLGAGVLVIVLAMLAAWWARGTSPAAVAAVAPPAGSSAQTAESTARMANANARIADSAAGVDSLPVLRPENPGDSLIASSYGVLVVSANTREGAILKLEQLGDAPAATIAPVLLAGAGDRWYRVVVGAERERSGADSLLTLLRARGSLGAEDGEIRRVPLAILLEEDLEPHRVAEVLAAWRRRGVRAYALRQMDGTVTLYTGAFETPEQAALLAPTVVSLGLEPTVVYRIGRVF